MLDNPMSRGSVPATCEDFGVLVARSKSSGRGIGAYPARQWMGINPAARGGGRDTSTCTADPQAPYESRVDCDAQSPQNLAGLGAELRTGLRKFARPASCPKTLEGSPCQAGGR